MEYINLLFNIIMGILFWHFVLKFRNSEFFMYLCSIQLTPRGEIIFKRTALLLTYLLLVDEVGLLVNEWGSNITLFSITRFFISLPLISQSVYLASTVIIVLTVKKLAYHQLKNTGISFDHIKHNIVYLQLVVLIISFLTFFLQEALVMIRLMPRLYLAKFFLYAFLFFVPAVLLFITLTRNHDSTHVDKSTTRLLNLTILFLSLCQSIVAKAIVLHELFLSIKNKISNSNKKSDPLLLCSTVTSNSFLSKFNLIIIISSLLPIMLIWLSQVSALPPITTIYPKGISISLCLTTAVLMYPTIEAFSEKFWSFSRLLFAPLFLIFMYSPFVLGGPEWFLSTQHTLFSTLYDFTGYSTAKPILVFSLYHLELAFLYFIIIADEKLLRLTERNIKSQIILTLILVFFSVFTPLSFVTFSYPVFLNAPPLILSTMNKTFLILIFALACISIIITYFTCKLIIADNSQWKKFVPQFAHKRKFILGYSIFLTLLLMLPITIYISTPIQRTGNISLFEIQPTKQLAWSDPLIYENGVLIYQSYSPHSDTSIITAIDMKNRKLLWSNHPNKRILKIKSLNDNLLIVTDTDEFRILENDSGDCIYRSKKMIMHNKRQVLTLDDINGFELFSNGQIIKIPIVFETPELINSLEGNYIKYKNSIFKWSQKKWKHIINLPLEDEVVYNVSIEKNISVCLTSNSIYWINLVDGTLVDNLDNFNNSTIEKINDLYIYPINNIYSLIFTILNDNTIKITCLDIPAKKIRWQDQIDKKHLFIDDDSKPIIHFTDGKIFYKYSIDVNTKRFTVPLFNLEDGSIFYTLEDTNNILDFNGNQKVELYDDKYIAIYNEFRLSLFDNKGRSINQYWLAYPEKLHIEQFKGTFGSMDETISAMISELISFTKPTYYNGNIYWIDIQGKIHKLELPK